MDARCIKYWDDAQELLQAAAADPQRASKLLGKMSKELRTMSRFLQKNQSMRFGDTAQQKLIDTIGSYVTFSKQQSSTSTSEVVEATFQVVKDGLAMPFNVVSTKLKNRLLKWYNELISVVGGDPDGEFSVEGLASAEEANKRLEWIVMDVDGDGYLSLLNEENGETCETFKVEKTSAQFKQTKKALDKGDTVAVVTVGDSVSEVNWVAE